MKNQMQRDNHVLVTGGAGYIGSHACKALFDAGYTPVTYDNLSRGNEWAVQWGPLEIGDILDGNRLDEVFSRYRPCAVMHFAALAYVGESVTDPLSYYRNNVTGSINLLRHMVQNGIDKLVFSSTCAVYGIPESLPLTEDHGRAPINPYGQTKAMVEQVLSDLSATGAIRFVSLRYFNAAGADPGGAIGEAHEPETHLIPLVLQVANGQRSHVDIYGTDYDTPDGTCIRDYIHVNDLADAHLKALEYLDKGGDSSFYNLGTEHGYSVKQIVENASRISGKRIEVKTTERRPGDPPCLVADAARIKNELGWAAHNSDIDTLLGSAWQWLIKGRI